MRKQPKARTTKSKSRIDAFAETEQKAKQKIVDAAIATANKNEQAWRQNCRDEKSI